MEMAAFTPANHHAGVGPPWFPLYYKIGLAMKSDKFIGVALVAFAAFMYYQAEMLPPEKFGTLGADLFPKILFVMLAIFGVLLFLGQWRKERRQAEDDGEARQDKGAAWDLKVWLAHYKFVIIGFAAFLGYVTLMYYLGYLVSTLIFMPILMWILGPRTKKAALTIASVTLGLTFFLDYSFTNLLKIFLPEGMLF